MKIVLTGGGTGGHAYPAISLAEVLRIEYPGCELLYIGDKNGPERKLASDAGITFHGLTSRKIRKLISPGTVLTMAALCKGFVESLTALNSFRPDIVIGTGGYASAAVVMAQVLRKGKTLIHEQNVVPGRTNLRVGRYATKICVTFEDSAKYFPAEKTVTTGLPIRGDLLNLPDKKTARETLRLDTEAFTVLVVGGSQGAMAINRVVADSIPLLAKQSVQVLHQVGSRNYVDAEKRCKTLGYENYHVRAYLEDMKAPYGAADLIICRSGASTIAEITAIGLPAILIPYPSAYADHQRLNGEYVARNGGGILINESDITPELLAKTVIELKDSEEALKQMSNASRRLGKPDAAHDIAVIAANLIQR